MHPIFIMMWFLFVKNSYQNTYPQQKNTRSLRFSIFTSNHKVSPAKRCRVVSGKLEATCAAKSSRNGCCNGSSCATMASKCFGRHGNGQGVPWAMKIWQNMVYARNPAPGDRKVFPSYTGLYTSQVVQDFFHQQYDKDDIYIYTYLISTIKCPHLLVTFHVLSSVSMFILLWSCWTIKHFGQPPKSKPSLGLHGGSGLLAKCQAEKLKKLQCLDNVSRGRWCSSRLNTHGVWWYVMLKLLTFNWST